MAGVGEREPIVRRTVRQLFKTFVVIMLLSLIPDSPKQASAEGGAASAPASAPATNAASAPASAPAEAKIPAAMTYADLLAPEKTVITGVDQTPPLDEKIRAIASGSPRSLKRLIGELQEEKDIRLIGFFENYSQGSLYLWSPHGKDSKISYMVVGLGDRSAGVGQTEFTLYTPVTNQQLMIDGEPAVVIKEAMKVDGKSYVTIRLGKKMLGILEEASSGGKKEAIRAMTVIRLSHPDPLERRKSIVKAGDYGQQAGGPEEFMPRLEALAKTEKDSRNLVTIEESLARINLERGAGEMISRMDSARERDAQLGRDLAVPNISEADKAELAKKREAIWAVFNAESDEAAHPELVEMRNIRHAAVKKLGELQSLRSLERIKEAEKSEVTDKYAGVYAAAKSSIASWQRTVDYTSYFFSGLSSASILIFMALGLAIIFGLMGVINMAHGEMMMVGAYSTYIVQELFLRYWPGAFDSYFFVAIPIAFVMAATIGIIIEATVVRFLYGRPLDTLLATFGVSYILIQTARTIFGNNIGVKAPTWLQGSFEPVMDIRFPYNRLFVIGFCIACVLLMYFIINRTRLGLLLRATTQNRQMAASCGVSTRKIDMMTFALGSGLAGMAGCALSQVDGVTPDMGQNYIIESFLVVVVGGVGKLAGALWSGLGLGMVRTWMEPVTGTIWAKVLILMFVIVFIQMKPSGLFPAKGRLADA